MEKQAGDHGLSKRSKPMIPPGWRHGNVIDFFELQRGFDLTEKDAIQENIPVYSSSGISYFHNEAKSKGPGVVTGRKGSIGQVHFVETDFWPHDTTLWVKNFKGNSPKYVKYFLEFLKLERYDEASSVPTLNRNNIHDIKCIFPPSEEQKRIVKIFKVWEDAISSINLLIAAKLERRSWLIQQLISGKMRFPSFKGNLAIKTLGELVDPVQRPIPKPTEGYKALGIRSHCKGTFVKNVVDPSTVDMEELFVVKKGDLIVNITFAWEGAIAFVPEEHTGHLVSHRFPTFRLKEDKVDVDFFRYIVTNPWFIFQLGLISPGGAGRNRVMSKRDFLDMEVSVPCLEEQRKIGQLLKLIDTEIGLLTQQLNDLKEQKKGLMQQLLTGRIRVSI